MFTIREHRIFVNKKLLMKKEIVPVALDNLRQTAGVDAVWKDDGPLDGKLTFTVNGQKVAFWVELKGELRTHHLQQIEEYFKQNADYLLLARRIYPGIKEELRLKGIPYLEANGNIFLKKGNLYLFIDTQKPMDIAKNIGNRAFTKTGLKVVFYLLQHKDAINLTHRELADKTNVGLGNIPQVIKGLRDTGYLVPLNKKSFVWENRNALLERWITEYATELRPKLKMEQFALKADWRQIIFDDYKTVWGGEPAADILTNYLRPERFTLYTNESRFDLIRNYKLIPDKNGEIEVLEMFWEPTGDKTVPPLLVYADLMIEGGKRNKETAEKIYHEYIRPNL